MQSAQKVRGQAPSALLQCHANHPARSPLYVGPERQLGRERAHSQLWSFGIQLCLQPEQYPKCGEQQPDFTIVDGANEAVRLD